MQWRKSTRVLPEPGRLERPFATAVACATEDCPELPDAAAAEREEARSEAYREGRRDAERELKQALEQTLEQARRSMGKGLERLAALERELTRKHERLLLEIALEAASRIVRQRIDADDPVAARALEEALDTLPAATRIRVRLHPDDLEPVAEAVRGEVDAGRIEPVADPGVSPGGALVESAVGSVDATLETAVDAARSAALGDEEVG
jgi:flagellar assembly protein FliH